MPNVNVDVTATNVANPQTPISVGLMAVVNPDGSPIAAGGGGGGGDMNLTQVGGTAVTLGAKAAAASIPVVLATGSNVATNLAQVGAAAVTLGQKAAAASIPVVLASNQTTLAVTLPQALVDDLSRFNFTVNSTRRLNVTETSSEVLLGDPATKTLRITNAGTELVFVAWGVGTQTATIASMVVLPGTSVEVAGNAATHVAAIAPDSTAAVTVYVCRGVGGH